MEVLHDRLIWQVLSGGHAFSPLRTDYRKTHASYPLGTASNPLGSAPVLLYALIHRSAWNGHSPKFAPECGWWHHASSGKVVPPLEKAGPKGASHEHKPPGWIPAHSRPRARRLGGRLRLAGRLRPLEAGRPRGQGRAEPDRLAPRRRRRDQDDHRRAERSGRPRRPLLRRNGDHRGG